MPGFFSVALAPALRSLQEELQPGEGILAFLDDTYMAASPSRATYLCGVLEHHLFSHACLRLNTAKTACWNAAGIAPAGVAQPDGGGPHSLHPSAASCCVPIGSPAFVRKRFRLILELRHHSSTHSQRWRMPGSHGYCCPFCAAPRALKRSARCAPCSHRVCSWSRPCRAALSCLADLLSLGANCDSLQPLPAARTPLSLRHGGLGFRSAVRHAPAAYWVSCTGCLQLPARRGRAFSEHMSMLGWPRLATICLGPSSFGRPLLVRCGCCFARVGRPVAHASPATA